MSRLLSLSPYSLCQGVNSRHVPIGGHIEMLSCSYTRDMRSEQDKTPQRTLLIMRHSLSFLRNNIERVFGNGYYRLECLGRDRGRLWQSDAHSAIQTVKKIIGVIKRYGCSHASQPDRARKNDIGDKVSGYCRVHICTNAEKNIS